MSDENAEISKEIRKQRESVYGSPAILQHELAAQWTALLRSYYQDSALPAVPPRLVGVMLACLKLHRIAVNSKKKDRDSYRDLTNYMNFAEEIDETLPPTE